MIVQCNGCKENFHISTITGGQYFCACGTCVEKVSIKFFNGDIAATIKFINAENWRRASKVRKTIENIYEEGDE